MMFSIPLSVIVVFSEVDVTFGTESLVFASVVITLAVEVVSAVVFSREGDGVVGETRGLVAFAE